MKNSVIFIATLIAVTSGKKNLEGHVAPLKIIFLKAVMMRIGH